MKVRSNHHTTTFILEDDQRAFTVFLHIETGSVDCAWHLFAEPSEEAAGQCDISPTGYCHNHMHSDYDRQAEQAFYHDELSEFMTKMLYEVRQ